MHTVISFSTKNGTNYLQIEILSDEVNKNVVKMHQSFRFERNTFSSNLFNSVGVRGLSDFLFPKS